MVADLSNTFIMFNKLDKYLIKSQKNYNNNNPIYKLKSNYYKNQLNKIIQNGGMSCNTCLDDSNIINSSDRQQILLNCGHSFCNVCWNTHTNQHVQSNIFNNATISAKTNSLSCPKCNEPVTNKKIITPEILYNVVNNTNGDIEQQKITLINSTNLAHIDLSLLEPSFDNLISYDDQTLNQSKQLSKQLSIQPSQTNRLNIMTNTMMLGPEFFQSIPLNMLPLQVGDIPDNITQISFGDFTNGGQPLVQNVLPKSLKTLSMGNFTNGGQPFGQNVLPPRLEFLIIDNPTNYSYNTLSGFGPIPTYTQVIYGNESDDEQYDNSENESQLGSEDEDYYNNYDEDEGEEYDYENELQIDYYNKKKNL
jgi:hypothetical protein